MKRYSETLYRKCVSFLRDTDAAKDCVQDVFICLWKHTSLQDIENLDHYLQQSARNGALDQIRKNKRKAAFDQDIARLTQYVLYGDALDHVILRELKQKLERVISTFPPAQQQEWRQNREDGMAYKEIAASLGISQKTVEKRMTASLKTLCKEMDNELGETLILALIAQAILN